MQLCPACGEDGTPNTLDHYLPKHDFPEFAIAPHNLFPMCDICQGMKGEKTVNSANERFFLHPYFDKFASQQVVKLSIAPPFNSPITFAINPHSCLSQSEAALVERHLKELDVAIRYQAFFKTEYIRLLKLVGRARDNQQSVKDRIDDFRQSAFDKAVNSWGHIFYDGVFSDLDLMNHLDSAALPHHL